MNEIDQKELAALDLCSHYFSRAVVVPRRRGFVLASWCVRCSQTEFSICQDDDEFPTEEFTGEET